MKSDQAYLALLAQERAVQAQADRTSLSLLATRRKAEHEQSRLDQRARENAIRVAHGKAPLPAVPEPDTDEEDEDSKTADEDGGKGKQPGDFDVVLEEASKVLNDVIVLRASTAAAAR